MKSLVALLALVPLGRQETTNEVRVAEPPPAERWRALRHDYDEALSKWYEVYNAAGEEERGELLDASHPARDYFARAEAIAREGVGEARLFLIDVMPLAGVPYEELGKRQLAEFAILVRDYRDADWITSLERAVPGIWWPNMGVEGVHERLIELVMEFLGNTTNADARVLTGLALAESMVDAAADDAQRDAAVAVIERLQSEDVPAATVERMQGLHFRAKYLRVGNQVPELVGADVDGNELSLSALRGRIVVVDFWGFW